MAEKNQAKKISAIPAEGYSYYISTDVRGIPHTFLTIVGPPPGNEKISFGFAPFNELETVGLGRLFDDTGHEFTTKLQPVSLSPEQYGNLATFINNTIDAPPEYNVFYGQQCANWVHSATNAIYGLPLSDAGGMTSYDPAYVQNAASIMASWEANPYNEAYDILRTKILAYSAVEIISAYARLSNYWPIMQNKFLMEKSDFIDEILAKIVTATKQLSPLVLDLNGDGVKTAALAGKDAVHFDHNGDGYAEATGWAFGGDGLLAIDLNKNGVIDSGKELFGDQTGQTNGFLALGKYDGNEDKRLTAEDAVWKNLRVWIDANQDGQTQNGELKTLDSLKITQIDLAYADVALTDNGNSVKQNGSFVINGATRTLSDVY